MLRSVDQISTMLKHKFRLLKQNKQNDVNNNSDTFKEQSHRHFFIQFEGTGNINESQTNEDEMWDSNENSGTNALLSKIL